MSYESLLQKLYNLKGSGLDLEKILERLGNPQQHFEAIRIAGTNGKGSVCAFLAQTLQEAGFRVGLFTSPHLVRPEERIQINGHTISSEEFQQQFECIWTVIKELYGADSENYARFFEVVTLMALDYFHRQKVNWAVIECGVGARHDATRVITPKVSVLTNVDLDHRETLGNTIAQIASQKAAVVSQHGTLITAEDKPEALAEIMRECALKQAKFVRLDSSELTVKSSSWEGQRFDWRDWKDLEISLLGVHQMGNAILALEASLALGEERVSESAIRAGLKNTRWPGRMELLRENPHVILDGAKNAAGLRALRKSLTELDYERLILILGIADRKDVEAMACEIVPAADEIICARASWRGVAPEILAQAIQACGRECWPAATVSEAIERALTRAREGDLICVTGSLFLVGEVRAWWTEQDSRAR